MYTIHYLYINTSCAALHTRTRIHIKVVCVCVGGTGIGSSSCILYIARARREIRQLEYYSECAQGVISRNWIFLTEDSAHGSFGIVDMTGAAGEFGYSNFSKVYIIRSSINSVL